MIPGPTEEASPEPEATLLSTQPPAATSTQTAAQPPGGEAFPQPVVVGAMFDPREIATYCALMPEYGIQAVTVSIPWNAIEPRQDVFRWERADEAIDQIRECGLTIGAHVLARSSWATEQPPASPNERRDASMPPLNMEDYYDFMFNLATHYRGRITRYSIENEAAAPQNWGSTPEAYAEMLQTAYQAVHDADPDAIVEPDGLSSTGLGLLVALDMLDRGQGTAAVEFLSRNYANFAPGRQGGDPVQVQSVADLESLRNNPLAASLPAWMNMLAANHQFYDAFQLHYYGPPDQLPVVMDWAKGRLQAAGATDMPIELWELGYGWGVREPLDLAAQAEAVPQLLATAVGEGSPFVIFWRFTDEIEKLGTGVTGLFADGEPRPAAAAYGVMANRLNGVTQSEPLDLGPELRGYRYKKNGEVFFVLWRSQPGTSQVALPVEAATVTVTTIDGQTSSANPQELSVGTSPIVVETE